MLLLITHTSAWLVQPSADKRLIKEPFLGRYLSTQQISLQSVAKT